MEFAYACAAVLCVMMPSAVLLVWVDRRYPHPPTNEQLEAVTAELHEVRGEVAAARQTANKAALAAGLKVP